jgi:hypothetical protein
MKELLTIIASVYGLLIGATFTCEIVHWKRNRARLKAKTVHLPEKELAQLFNVEFDHHPR